MTRAVRPRLKGRSVLIRFAADCCIGCEREVDARKVMAVLPKQFARLGLRVSSGEDGGDGVRETRGPSGIGSWERPMRVSRSAPLLGRNRAGVFGVIKRRTARQRPRRTKKAWWRWCRANRRAPVDVAAVPDARPQPAWALSV